jgi:hypothetical protein
MPSYDLVFLVCYAHQQLHPRAKLGERTDAVALAAKVPEALSFALARESKGFHMNAATNDRHSSSGLPKPRALPNLRS